MQKEAIEKYRKRFRQVYLDTVKHEHDIEKWIKTGARKKGDIRRSLQRLEEKYKELGSLKEELEKEEIYESELLDNISCKNKYSVMQIKNRIRRLYNLAGIEKKQEKQISNRPSIYGKEIDLVTDIPGNPEMLGLVKRKKNTKSKKEKNKSLDFKKLGRRIATFAMAIIMTIFAGARARDTIGFVEEKERNPYIDTNREDEKQNFRETLYVEVAETIKQETESIAQEETKPAEQIKQEDVKEDNIQISEEEEKQESLVEEENNYYLAKSGIKYTEVSDGSGNVGYFSKDTEVKVYNRALVKIDKDGSKQILEVTKIGQTWREYAEEHGLNYDEFKKYMNNKNIQNCVSLQSSNGQHNYGWVLEDTLEEIGEIER